LFGWAKNLGSAEHPWLGRAILFGSHLLTFSFVSNAELLKKAKKGKAERKAKKDKAAEEGEEESKGKEEDVVEEDKEEKKKEVDEQAMEGRGVGNKVIPPGDSGSDKDNNVDDDDDDDEEEEEEEKAKEVIEVEDDEEDKEEEEDKDKDKDKDNDSKEEEKHKKEEEEDEEEEDEEVKDEDENKDNDEDEEEDEEEEEEEVKEKNTQDDDEEDDDLEQEDEEHDEDGSTKDHAKEASKGREKKGFPSKNDGKLLIQGKESKDGEEDSDVFAFFADQGTSDAVEEIYKGDSDEDSVLDPMTKHLVVDEQFRKKDKQGKEISGPNGYYVLDKKLLNDNWTSYYTSVNAMTSYMLGLTKGPDDKKWKTGMDRKKFSVHWQRWRW